MASTESQKHGSALEELQSEEQVKLLDTIDQLRFHGLSRELKLPQLIVCGNQSTGKSSVLEAISGVKFPASDQICTRFATELILRKASTFSLSVAIAPAKHRSEAEKATLEKVCNSTKDTSLEQFPSFIRAAIDHMNELSHASKFFEDKLVVEVHGPSMPPLTLVDLPGVIGFSNEAKSEGDMAIATATKIVENYMAQTNSIILAVVDLSNNFENQKILQMLKDHDEAGERTLGILTKPDLVPEGSGSEADAIRCAMNEFLPFKLGWHTLVNRNFKSRNASSSERDANEEAFFRKPNWQSIPEGDRGAKALRTKLAEILFRAVRINLTSITQDIRSKISTCEATAKALGKPKLSQDEHRNELMEVSTKLHTIVAAGVCGDYNASNFFLDTSRYRISPRRLRAFMWLYLERFARRVKNDGKMFDYASQKHPPTHKAINFSSQTKRTEDETMYLAYEALQEGVNMHIAQNRGQEPPGVVPVVVYASILSFQCSRWESIAIKCAQNCLKIAEKFFVQALSYENPRHIANRVKEKFVRSHFDTAEEKLMDKLRELLGPYQNRTFFTPNMPAATDATAGNVLTWVSSAYEVRALQSSMSPADFRQIALNNFIDNFANLAIEACVIQELAHLFTPMDVGNMKSDILQYLTSEPQHIWECRETNNSELAALQQALRVCNEHSNDSGKH